ncbi:MAG: hypothetical protein ABIA47_02760 [bacterium]
MCTTTVDALMKKIRTANPAQHTVSTTMPVDRQVVLIGRRRKNLKARLLREGGLQSRWIILERIPTVPPYENLSRK